jgi:uncharacterized protein
MPFRRRYPLTFRERVRRAITPPKSFRRALTYYRLKVLRIGGSPHAVATGLAIGIISAWTPFIGFHAILALLVAYLVGGSLIAAALGTTFANPVTCPIIWPLTWKIGALILGHDPAGRDALDFGRLFESFDLTQLWRPVLEPMMIGSLPPGLLSGILFYALTYWAVRSFRDRRLERLTARTEAPKSA